MAELNRQDVETYIRLHAQAALLEKEMKPLKEKLLPLIVDGAVSPADLPFVLVNKPQNRKERDWEGFVTKLLRSIFGSTKRAKAEFEKIEARWPEKKIPALHVEKNPAYAATVGMEAAAAQ